LLPLGLQAISLDGFVAGHYSGPRSGSSMRDKNLERNIRRVEAFVEQWKRLSQFFDRGFQAQSFTAEEEAAFLQLKSQIAQEYALLMVTLAAHERDDRPLKLLNAVPSLQVFKELPNGMAKKVVADWHNIYLWSQSLLGRLRGRKAQLAQLSTLRIAVQRVFTHPLMILFLLVAAGYGVYKFADEWFPKVMNFMERKD
jgi:hypothetical protein